jgi:hypothetical protein
MMIAIAIITLGFIVALNGSKKLVQLGFQVCQMVFEYFSCFFTPYRGQKTLSDLSLR